MIKKPKAVCPYACPYENMKQERRGRKPRSPETMRKQIDKALDLMFAAEDFWTLETLRRLLVCLTLFDDAALRYGLTLMDLNDATEEQHQRIGRFISHYLRPLPPRKESLK